MEERDRGNAALDRIVFFADAVFAIAITLIVVEISVPKVAGGDLADALGDQWPEFLSFALTFLVVGTWWVAHHRMFRYIVRFDTRLLQLQLVFLMGVAFTPYPTNLLGNYLSSPTAVVLYAATLAAVGYASAALWGYSTWDRRLVPKDLDPRLIEYFQARSLVIPTVFLTSIPLAFVNTDYAEYWWIWAYALTVALSRRYRDVQL
jgi:TMEM175 potassium channel family protein